jgi:sulfite exporter TauE/SafE
LSAPWIETLHQLGPWVATVSVAFLGSAHCAAMCGGIAAAALKPREAVAYQLGRLAGYLSLGAAAGALGSGIASELRFSGLPWLAAAFAAAAVLWAGATLWRGSAPLPARLGRAWARFTPALVSRAARALRSWPSARAGLLGGVTGLLPCGWLHGFVLVAAASGSAVRGAAVLGALWLGSVPALSAAPALWRLASRRSATPWLRRGLAAALVAAGLFGVGTRFAPAHSRAHSSDAPSQHDTPAELHCH